MSFKLNSTVTANVERKAEAFWVKWFEIQLKDLNVIDKIMALWKKVEELPTFR